MLNTKICRAERSRIAQLRRWLRLCVEVCVYSTEFGYVQVRKNVAEKLLKKFGGQMHGRYCPVFQILFVERLLF